MADIEGALRAHGLELPAASAPVANYVGAAASRGLLVVSGQLPLGVDGKIADRFKGKVGTSVALEDAQAAARACALNALAQAKLVLGGDLTRLKRCLRLGGFINCASDYAQLPVVMNGASDLMAAAMGDAGRHARTTVGVAQLPLDAAVEVEALFEID